MKGVWIIVFAGIAAVGNGLFALGQRQSSGIGGRVSFFVFAGAAGHHTQLNVRLSAAECTPKLPSASSASTR